MFFEKALRVFSILTVSSIGLFVLWLAGALRTGVFGLNPQSLIVSVGFFSAFSTAVALTLYGTTRKAALFTVMMTLSMLLIVEGYAGAQEVIAARSHACPNPEGNLHFENRWWPYHFSGFFCTDGRWVTYD